jgi:16S rRNA (cytosine967-C5)-methyltransferase
MQIMIGVIKNLLHLQWLIERYSGRSRKSIDPLVQKITSIGLYQLRFLDRIPPSAAVNEAVEQTKRFGRKRAAGFVNAVLREAQRRGLPPAPDRKSEPQDYARVMLSCPPELFGKLEELVGIDQALLICEQSNREPPLIVRLIRGTLEAEGVKVYSHEKAGMFVVEGATAAQIVAWARAGIAQPQDPTSAEVISKLGIHEGETVLDRCCGMGTKTLQIAAATGKSGTVIAMDRSEERCRMLSAAAKFGDMANIRVHRGEVMTDIGEQQSFSRILVDAPCSNSGVMARRAEARYAQDEKTLRSLARLQDWILDDTAPALLPGGKMVYSTCSIWAEENGKRVRAFVGRHADYRLVEEKLTLPSLESEATRYHDGGYFAVLERSWGMADRPTMEYVAMVIGVWGAWVVMRTIANEREARMRVVLARIATKPEPMASGEQKK